MRYRDTQSMKTLIDTVLSGMPGTKKEEPVVIQCWDEIFPEFSSNLQRILLKGKVLYVKVSSPFLRHQMHLKEREIHASLVTKIKEKGINPRCVESIFFM